MKVQKFANILIVIHFYRYPKCWQVDCKQGPASDKEAFANWVQELSVALHKENMLLSSAVSDLKLKLQTFTNFNNNTSFL